MWGLLNILGDQEVTANNHATFVIQIQIKLRDYLRLLMVRTLTEPGAYSEFGHCNKTFRCRPLKYIIKFEKFFPSRKIEALKIKTPFPSIVNAPGYGKLGLVSYFLYLNTRNETYLPATKSFNTKTFFCKNVCK